MFYLEMETEKGKEVKTMVWSRESHIFKFFFDKCKILYTVAQLRLIFHSDSSQKYDRTNILQRPRDKLNPGSPGEPQRNYGRYS